MWGAWSRILDALPPGCRLSYFLEEFLVKQGRKPAIRYGRFARFGGEIGMSNDKPVIEVIVAAHEVAAAHALVAALDADQTG
jgi:hypothetical protein